MFDSFDQQYEGKAIDKYESLRRECDSNTMKR